MQTAWLIAAARMQGMRLIAVPHGARSWIVPVVRRARGSTVARLRRFTAREHTSRHTSAVARASATAAIGQTNAIAEDAAARIVC